MKKLFFVMMVFILFMGCKKESTTYEGNWIKQSDFEGLKRGNAVSFVLGDKVYFGLGYNSNEDEEYLKDFWVYDSGRDFWTRLSDFPGEARGGAVSFTINGKGYVGIGYNGKEKLKDFWEFDPSTNTWTRMADFAGSARYAAVGFALGNKGYLGTGFDDSECRDFWQFEPSANLWSQIASVGGSKRQDAVTFSIDGKAYVFGGTNNGSYLKDLWQFDPETGAWTQKGDLDEDTDWTIARSSGCNFTLGGRGYVGLGYYSGTRNDFWEYNPTGDTWIKKTDFEGTGRQNTVSFVVNNRAYVALGKSGSYFFDDVWEFRPFDEADVDD